MAGRKKRHPKHRKQKKKCKLCILTAIILVIAIAAIVFYLTRNKDVVAYVNGEPIMLEQMKEDYDLLLFVGGYPREFRESIISESLPQFLNQSIAENLLLQEAKKQGIAISDEETERLFNDALDRSLIDLEELKLQLEQEGFAIDDLKRLNKRQMIINGLLNKTLPQVEISDLDAKKYYDENKDVFEGKAFNEVKEQIKKALQLREQQILAQEYVLKLWSNADVRVKFSMLEKENSQQLPEIIIS